MTALIFDIETGPLPEPDVLAMMPPFRESEVALGNTRDPELIRARIEEARQNHKRRWMDEAALAAMTGRVLAIGMVKVELQDSPAINENAIRKMAELIIYDGTASGIDNPELASPQTPGSYCMQRIPYCDGQPVFEHDAVAVAECSLLRGFWTWASSVSALVGWCIHDFDLPFLMQRSLYHGVEVPQMRVRGHWAERIVDLKQVWRCGSMNNAGRGCLDQVSRFVGGPGKNGSGAMFHEEFTGGHERWKRAMRYLENDLEMTLTLAERMHRIQPLVPQSSPWL